jgi:hypothetical protein
MASEHECKVSVGEEWDENFDVNFLELRYGEVRRIPLPRTPVNKGKRKDRSLVRLGPSKPLHLRRG